MIRTILNVCIFWSRAQDNFMSVVIFSLLLSSLSLPWLNLRVFSSDFYGYSVLL